MPLAAGVKTEVEVDGLNGFDGLEVLVSRYSMTVSSYSTIVSRYLTIVLKYLTVLRL